ncbi:arginase-1 [Acrasis kona]|uniref:Arginase-1 n=1 Tax=Acrasis kona TaxID=1008807 RepID=A0AAW2YQ76_9EUKA
MKNPKTRSLPLDMRSPYNLEEVQEYLVVYYQTMFVPLCVIILACTLAIENPYYLFLGICVASVPLLFLTYKKLPFLYIVHLLSLGVWIAIITRTRNHYYPPEQSLPKSVAIIPSNMISNYGFTIQIPHGHTHESIEQLVDLDYDPIDHSKLAFASISGYDYPCVLVKNHYYIIKPAHRLFCDIARVDVEDGTFTMNINGRVKSQKTLELYTFLSNVMNK